MHIGAHRVMAGQELEVDDVLYKARQRADPRQVPPKEAELVHLRERLRRPPPRAANVEEELAHRRRALKPPVHEVEGVLERALEVEGQLAAQTMQVPEDLHDA